jgi:hypothetical protein
MTIKVHDPRKDSESEIPVLEAVYVALYYRLPKEVKVRKEVRKRKDPSVGQTKNPESR